MFRYWWKVFKQAIFESWTSVREHWTASMIAFVAAPIAGGIWFAYDADQWIDQVTGGIIGAISGLLVVAAIFAAMSALRLFSVPARWDQEKSHQISTLSAKLNSKENRPIIEIPFDGADHHFSRTHFGSDVENKVIFVSVRVIARPSGAYIKECRGFVDAVHTQGSNGEWVPTTLNRPQILEWSSEGTGGSAKSDLDSDQGRFLNIFYISRNENVIRPCIPHPLYEYIEIFNNRNQIYKFDIRVRSYGESESGLISLRAKLGENWDDIQIERI